MTTLTITKEAPPTMWPAEILFKGNYAWRATLAATSSAAYFFFLQKTGYYPLKSSERIWQHIAATALLQYSFYKLGIDQKLISLFGSEVDTAIAYVKNSKKVPLTTTQEVLAFFVGKERFNTFLQEEESEEAKTRLLCERLSLRKNILDHEFTIDDSSSSTTLEVARFALFGFATIASTVIFQNTYPHLSTAGRALRYVISNIWLDLAIDASAGEAPVQSPAQIVDLADFENLESLSPAEKRRRTAFYVNQLENVKITDLTAEMNALIDQAKELDTAKKELSRALAQDIYSRLTHKKEATELVFIRDNIQELATFLPNKSYALIQLTKKFTLFDLSSEVKRKKIALCFKDILEKADDYYLLPWYKKIFYKRADPNTDIPASDDKISLEDKEPNDKLKTAREDEGHKNQVFKEAKLKLHEKHPSNPHEDTKKLEELEKDLRTFRIQYPIALLYACFDDPQYELIQKLHRYYPNELASFVADRGSAAEKEIIQKIPFERVKIQEILHKLFPQYIGRTLKTLSEQENSSNDEHEKAETLRETLKKYYPNVKEIEKSNSEFPDYECENYEKIEKNILYYEDRIRVCKEKDSPLKLGKILSTAIKVLSLLNQTTYFDFFKMTIPLKEVGLFSKENIGDIAMRIIFNQCVKKL